MVLLRTVVWLSCLKKETKAQKRGTTNLVAIAVMSVVDCHSPRSRVLTRNTPYQPSFPSSHLDFLSLPLSFYLYYLHNQNLNIPPFFLNFLLKFTQNVSLFFFLFFQISLFFTLISPSSSLSSHTFISIHDLSSLSSSFT